MSLSIRTRSEVLKNDDPFAVMAKGVSILSRDFILCEAKVLDPSTMKYKDITTSPSMLQYVLYRVQLTK
jgi:hypothetical protein